jgi:galactose-1-phosphate uridylyltransferase
MDEITFTCRTETAVLRNPLNAFAEEQQRLEIRLDPLLGHASVYNPAIESGLKTFIGDVDLPLLERLAEQTASTCFFCPGRIDSTARFPDALIPGGRLAVGEATLFANLFALAPYHAVIAVSHAHWLLPGGFTLARVRDALQAAWQFIVAVFRADTQADYATVNANYLFPAGASLLHPHFQVLVGATPYTHQDDLLRACARYLHNTGRVFHEALIATEQRIGERYIAQQGPWHWLASYSPLGANEIVGIHAGNGDFAAQSASDLDSLAEGLAGVLACYGHMGYHAFNFSLYARRAPARDDGFRCMIRCMTRQNPYPNYRADDYFLQKGLASELILTRPERLAAEARRFVATRAP